MLGESPLADFARTVLDKHGVVYFDHDARVDLPKASVWVDGSGERTILSTDNKRSEVVAKADAVEMSDVSAVLLDGHYPRLQLMLGQAAAAAGIPVVLDCGRWRPIYTDLLPVASEVIMTESFRPPHMADLATSEAVQAIRDEYRLGLVAASRGGRSVLMADGDGYTELQVPTVEVMDTLGAGDVLHGAYLHYRFGEGLGEPGALVSAIDVASRSCQVRGIRYLTNTE